MAAVPEPDIRLEPVDRGHLAALAPLLDDPAVLRFTRVPVPVPDGFMDAWMTAYQRGRDEGTMEGFAIVDGGAEVLGLAVVPRIDRDTATAELGYVIAPKARGRGIATAALRLLTAWAFGQGAQRLELMISPDNAPSKRVAERCGYVYEGTLRSLHFKQGLREDTQIWSRLPSDPAVVERGGRRRPPRHEDQPTPE
jgi:RimJ/RimL family protein N-acetyltransferase